MDQEKNINEEVVETAEVIEEAVEEVVEEVSRPEVYDDFSEEYEEKPAVKKETVWTPKKIITIASVISTVVSLVVVLFASLCVKYVPIAVTSAQTSGVWACDVVSYANETMRIYIVMDDGKFIAGTNETGAAVEYEYKVIEGGKIEVVETSGLANELRVKIEDGNLVFSPSVFGGDKWQKVEKEEAKNIKAILTTPAVIPDEYVDIAE